MPATVHTARSRLHRQSWLIVVCAGVTLGVAAMAGLEVMWRHMGHSPSVVDDEALWSLQRDRIQQGDPHVVVLLGWSRMLYDFAPQVFEREFTPYKVANLAIEGKHPIAVLRDLAADPSFVGVVVCDITYEGVRQARWDEQQPHVDYYHNTWKVGKKFERWLKNSLQQRFVCIRPTLGSREIIQSLWHDDWPKPFHVVVHANRWWEADFTKADFKRIHEVLRQRAEDAKQAKPIPDQQYIDGVKGLETFVQQIQSRGGKVVFVRMPTGLKPPEDPSQFPKQLGWKELEKHTAAATIHFADVPALSRFICWDASHIDGRDSAAFTVSLGRELEKKGIIPATSQ